MSKVSITGDNSGTGTFTVAAPDSNNNRTFNLPDEDGVVITDSSDIEPQVKTSLNATGDAPMFACRAFVNFDGTGTVSIRDSGNVSSITDNGTGNYTVNFTTAMPDTNYCVTSSTPANDGNRAGIFIGPKTASTSSPNAQDSLGIGSIDIQAARGSTSTSNGGATDPDAVFFAVFR